MLTPEQLRNIRDCANDGMPFNANTILMLCDHIDALQAQLQLANDCQEPLFDELAEKQARIAELEAQLTRIQRLADCGTVQNWLALPDEDKARWFAVTAQRDSEHCKLIAEMEQDAARYRWTDPNDKAQKQYLPWIGEAVLFCHGGVTYYGQHTGGSFQTGRGVTARNFNTWECRWMYPPAAMQSTWPEDTSDYGSRIAVIGQNGEEAP